MKTWIIGLFAALFLLASAGCGCQDDGKECTKNQDCCSGNCLKDALGAGPKSHCAAKGVMN